VSLDEVRAVFETNVFGVVAITHAMLPLLREAPAARIVNVSSGVEDAPTSASSGPGVDKRRSIKSPSQKFELTQLPTLPHLELCAVVIHLVQ
jgi:NAD(P)-dependent dehydrogenase (short-subunit alcohol dehydrogenase family)